MITKYGSEAGAQSKVQAAMQHAQLLHKIPSAPAKLEFNVLRYEHYHGTYIVETNHTLGTGLQ